MLEFYAENFFKATQLLSTIRAALDITGPLMKANLLGAGGPYFTKTSPEMQKMLEELCDHLERIGLTLTAKGAARIRQQIFIPQTDPDALNRLISDFMLRMQDEIGNNLFLSLSTKEKALFNPGAPPFGDDVPVKLPKAIFEIDEAGKCLATGRYTACVFHLMRTLEIGINAVRECLSIPESKKPAERNWGAYLRLMKEELEGRNKQGLWKTSADREFFESVYASFDAVRNTWRNATMHVETKYTEEEAEHIYAAVRAFIMKITLKMDEDGNPKV